MNWKEVLGANDAPQLSISTNSVEFLTSELCKIGERQYALVDSYEEDGKITRSFDTLYWAASDGAALRAAETQIESDDGAIAEVPTELLPNGANGGYLSVLSAVRTANPSGVIESASYRIMSDGAFIHRQIATRDAKYFFRQFEGDLEKPYAVLKRLSFAVEIR